MRGSAAPTFVAIRKEGLKIPCPPTRPLTLQKGRAYYLGPERCLHSYLPHPPPPIGGGDGPPPWRTLPSRRGPPGPGLLIYSYWAYNGGV